MPLGVTQAQQPSLMTPASARVPKRRKRAPMVSFSSMASYLGVFLLIVSLVAVSYQPPRREASVAAVGTPEAPAVNTAPADVTRASVDSLMATAIGATIAESTDLPIAFNVMNLSQSLAAESTLAQTDTNVISKPQIVQAASDTRMVKTYTTVVGDTIPSIAQKFGISAQTVKWANSLTSDAIEPGHNLSIPPVDGVTYVVRDGDTVDSIASKYKASSEQIVTFNDLELVGNPATGTSIIIPNGDLPETERPGYTAPAPRVNAGVSYGNYSGGSGTASNLSASVGNRYAYGNCTWYVYERRLQLGRPIGSFWGNANTWAINASAAGFAVNGSPAPGAIMQNGGGYGHVAVVESVNPGVSITISEMNGYRFNGGFNRIGRGEIPWSDATSGYYKYIH